MTYLDKKMKALLKKYDTTNIGVHKASVKRSKAYEDIQKTLAKAILGGSFLSQEVWTLPADWVNGTTPQNYFSLEVTSDPRKVESRWGNIITYMKDSCYQVPLGKGISLSYGGRFNLRAENSEDLSVFIKKYGLNILCPDVDEVIQHLEDRLVFVNNIKSSFQKI